MLKIHLQEHLDQYYSLQKDFSLQLIWLYFNELFSFGVYTSKVLESSTFEVCLFLSKLHHAQQREYLF